MPKCHSIADSAEALIALVNVINIALVLYNVYTVSQKNLPTFFLQFCSHLYCRTISTKDLFHNERIHEDVVYNAAEKPIILISLMLTIILS